MIVECFCPHRYQDERYGTGRRVANKLDHPKRTKIPGKIEARCTVCGRDQAVSK